MAAPTETVVCATCKGTSLHARFLCEACDSKGKVQVLSPAKSCPLCYGSGTSTTDLLRCVECRGTGWARLSSPSS